MNSSTNDIHFDSAVEFTNSDKSSKGELFSHAKFLSVIGIFCAVFLVAVFAFDYFLVQGSQTQKVMNDVSVSQAPSTNQAHATVAASLEPIERQPTTLQAQVIEVNAAISNEDFKVEAEQVLYRDESK